MDVDGIAKTSGSGDLFVAGGWRPAADGRTYPVTDPATGELSGGGDPRRGGAVAYAD